MDLEMHEKVANDAQMAKARTGFGGGQNFFPPATGFEELLLCGVFNK